MKTKSKNFWDTNKNPITMKVVETGKESAWIRHNESHKLDYDDARNRSIWI